MGENLREWFDDMNEREYLIENGIYPTRYMADKVRRSSEWHSSSERIVKVEGGYKLMNEKEYQIWRGQK